MARIGIGGSSYDPPTSAHLFALNTIAQEENLDVVFCLPSSSHRSDKQMKTSDEHRWNMLSLAVEGNDLLIADDYELRQIAGFHYTYATLNHFKKKFPDDEIFFIMGSDILDSLSSWHEAEKLVKENRFIVIQRDDQSISKLISRNPLLRNNKRNFTIVDKGLLLEISSSYVRDEWRYGGDPRYLVSDRVYEYMISHNIYGARDNLESKERNRSRWVLEKEDVKALNTFATYKEAYIKARDFGYSIQEVRYDD